MSKEHRRRPRSGKKGKPKGDRDGSGHSINASAGYTTCVPGCCIPYTANCNTSTWWEAPN
jgi:hypothetical protein